MPDYIQELLSLARGGNAEQPKATDQPVLVSITPEQRKSLRYNSPELDEYASFVEQRYGLPPGLIKAIKNSGERSNSNQVSPKGAQGVMQFIPGTWKQYGKDADPTDPVASIDAAGAYFKDLLQRYNGNVDAAVTEYNGGVKQAQAVAGGGNPWVPETVSYLARIRQALAQGGQGQPPQKKPVPVMSDPAIQPGRNLGGEAREEERRRREFEEQGAFTRGLGVVLPQMKQAAGAGVALFGSKTGNKDLQESGLDIYQDGSKEAEKFDDPSASLSNVLEGKGSFGDFAKYWAGYGLGQAVTSAITGLAGAAVGGAAGSAVPGAGTAAGTVSGFVGGVIGKGAVKQALVQGAEKLLAKEVQAGIARGLTKEAAEAAAAPLVKTWVAAETKKAGVRALAAAGAASGLYAQNTGMELGETYGHYIDEMVRSGRPVTPEDEDLALKSAMAAAGVETVADMLGLGRLLGGAKGAAANGFMANIAKEVALGIGREVPTEVAQTAIERVGKQQPLDSAEAMREYVDAAGGAAVPGALFGAGAGVKRTIAPNSPLSNAATAAGGAGPAVQAPPATPGAPAPGAAPAGATAQGPAAQAPADPISEKVEALRPFLEDKELVRAIRNLPELGPESVNELLAAWALARNPNTNPKVRASLLEQIGQFVDSVQNRPNWTFGKQAQPEAEQGDTPNVPTVPGQGQPPGTAPAPRLSDDGMTLDGQAREVPPAQLKAPPKPALETGDALRDRAQAMAEYEQAFQDLVKAEQLGESDVELQAKQKALQEAEVFKKQAEARLQEIRETIEGNRRLETERKRNAVLDSVLADKETVNPAERFASELKRQGFGDTVPTPGELARIARFEDIKAAEQQAPDALPSAPNEFNPYEPPKERKNVGNKPAAANATVGAKRAQGGRDVAPRGVSPARVPPADGGNGRTEPSAPRVDAPVVRQAQPVRDASGEQAPELSQDERRRHQIAEHYAHLLNKTGVPGDREYRLADDILNKNAYGLEWISNGMNPKGKEVFSKWTGVQLPKQNGATWKAIRDWAGISDEQEAVRVAKHKVDVQIKSLEGRFADLNEAHAWVRDKIEQGYRSLENLGGKWVLRNPSTDRGFDLSKRGTRLSSIRPLIAAEIELYRATEALEPKKVEPPKFDADVNGAEGLSAANPKEQPNERNDQQPAESRGAAAASPAESQGAPLPRPAGPWSAEELNERGLVEDANNYLSVRDRDGVILTGAINATIADREKALGLPLPGVGGRDGLPASLAVTYDKGEHGEAAFAEVFRAEFGGEALEISVSDKPISDEQIVGVPPLVLKRGEGEELYGFRVDGLPGDLFDFVDAVEQAYALLAERASRSPKGQQIDDQVSTQLEGRDEPTDAQKEAENYQKAHVSVLGLEISVETEKGAQRTGKDKDGGEWSVTMPAHYGYIKGTRGADKDHLDIFLGPKPDNGQFYVVNQNQTDSDKFDEHKVMLGYDSPDAAHADYLLSFSDAFGGRVFGSIAGPFSLDEFKAMLPDLAKPKAVKARGAEVADVKPASEFEHNGVRIYPASVNVAGERKRMWGVESAENKAKREAGERYGFGDSLHDTQEQAREAADRQIREEQERADYRRHTEELEAKERARIAERKADTVNGFLDGKAPNTQELIRKALDKQYRFDGTVMTVRERIESLHKSGLLETDSFEEPKIKPMSRAQFNRASQREQDAHEKKMREAGTKTIYTVNGSELGKTAYDYATYLSGKLRADFKDVESPSENASEIKADHPAAAPQEVESPDSGSLKPAVQSFKHTKTGETIYSVTMPVQVSREDYQAINRAAVRNGGRWSSFKGAGVIPGFHFKSEEKAKAFAADSVVAGVLANYDRKPVEPAKPTAGGEAALYSPAAELRTPETLDAMVGDLDAGYRVHVGQGEFGMTMHIAQVNGGWVLRTQDDDSPVTVTKGGVGPGDRGKWSKSRALEEAENKAGWAFKREDPAPAKPDADLVAIFEGMDSGGLAKNRAEKAAAEHPMAESIRAVDDGFHDMLMSLMDAGILEINGQKTITEDNKKCV